MAQRYTLAKQIGGDGSPDHQYFNIQLYNDPGYGGVIPAQYTQSFPTPFIDKPSDYIVNVERFRVPTSQIPIFIWPDPVYPPTVDPTTITTATYWVSLRYVKPGAGIDQTFSSPVYYTTPSTYSQFWPGQITTFPVLTGTRGQTEYGIWTILDFLELIHRAFQNAFALLVAAFPGSSPALTPGLGPLVGYDYFGSNIISIDVPNSFSQYYNALQNDYVRVYTNSQLAAFFPNFRSALYSYSVLQTPTLDYEILILPQTTTTILGYAYLTNLQELPTYAQWSSLASIIFTTNYIPINPEAAPAPVRSGDPASGSNVLFAIADFEPQGFAYPYEYINHVQTGPRRYADLRSETPLSRVDLQVYWEDKQGNLYPVQLGIGDAFSIKLEFKKKTAIGDMA